MAVLVLVLVLVPVLVLVLLVVVVVLVVVLVLVLVPVLVLVLVLLLVVVVVVVVVVGRLTQRRKGTHVAGWRKSWEGQGFGVQVGWWFSGERLLATMHELAQSRDGWVLKLGVSKKNTNSGCIKLHRVA